MTSLRPPDRLRWLFLDLNSYFASVEQNENPALLGKPIAVLPLMSDSTCVIAASLEAKKFGIKTGTPVWEAKQKCPGLICLSGKHDLYVEYHHRILDEVDKYIPVTKICSIDEAACLLDKHEQQRDIAIDLAHRIKAGLRQNIGPAMTCSIGLAPSRLLAKIGTDMQKPDGLVVLEPQDLPGRLFDLGLTDLPGIGHGMAKRLARGGITTVEAFWNLDARHARRLWGSVNGERYWYALHGYDFPEFGSDRSSVSHSQILAPETRVWNEARHVGRRLTQKAASRLRRMTMAAQHFGLSVQGVKGERWATELPIGLAQDNFTFLNAFEQLWKAAGTELREPHLRKVGIWMGGMVKPGSITGDLFGASRDLRQQQRHENASAAIDGLNKKYGRDTVIMGMPAKKLAHYTGTKVAFTRIPDMEEFYE